jgi:hypothetical protein
MPRCGVVLLILGDDRVVPARISRNRAALEDKIVQAAVVAGVESVEIEPTPRCGTYKVVAFVPSVGTSIPENRSDSIGELERTAFDLRSRT